MIDPGNSQAAARGVENRDEARAIRDSLERQDRFYRDYESERELEREREQEELDRERYRRLEK